MSASVISSNTCCCLILSTKRTWSSKFRITAVVEQSLPKWSDSRSPIIHVDSLKVSCFIRSTNRPSNTVSRVSTTLCSRSSNEPVVFQFASKSKHTMFPVCTRSYCLSKGSNILLLVSLCFLTPLFMLSMFLDITKPSSLLPPGPLP